jgi:vancomycin permeability regulator SanA
MFVGGTNAWLLAQADAAGEPDLLAAPNKTVAIVPGARVHGDRPSMLLRNRLKSALELYRAVRVTTILVSGNDTASSPEVPVMRDWLRDRGVPQTAILTDAGGHRTRETMVRASTLFDVRHAVVCTETLSMPRALYLARHSGIDAAGLALPTELTRSPQWVARETLKNTLAFVESHFRSLPARDPWPVAQR